MPKEEIFVNKEKLQNIRQAEASAKEIRDSVEGETQQIIHNAHNEVANIMDKAKNDARNYEEKLLAEYHHKGETKATTILSDLDRAIQEVNEHAQKGKQEVVNFLNERMKVSYGNS